LAAVLGLDCTMLFRHTGLEARKSVFPKSVLSFGFVEGLSAAAVHGRWVAAVDFGWSVSSCVGF
jgi:hypothetical protein